MRFCAPSLDDRFRTLIRKMEGLAMSHPSDHVDPIFQRRPAALSEAGLLNAPPRQGPLACNAGHFALQ